jgi:hypothetical protein
MMNLALWSVFVHSSKGSLTCCKILRQGRWLYFFSQGRHAADFYRLYKSITLGQVWTCKT